MSPNPCPFCAHPLPVLHPRINRSRAMTEYQLYCTHCQAVGPVETDPDAAVRAWNSRSRAVRVPDQTKVHLEFTPTTAACGQVPSTNAELTMDKDLVTCRRCKRTRRYKS